MSSRNAPRSGSPFFASDLPRFSTRRSSEAGKKHRCLSRFLCPLLLFYSPARFVGRSSEESSSTLSLSVTFSGPPPLIHGNDLSLFFLPPVRSSEITSGSSRSTGFASTDSQLKSSVVVAKKLALDFHLSARSSLSRSPVRPSQSLRCHHGSLRTTAAVAATPRPRKELGILFSLSLSLAVSRGNRSSVKRARAAAVPTSPRERRCVPTFLMGREPSLKRRA